MRGRKKGFRRILLIIFLIFLGLLVLGSLVPLNRWAQGHGYLMTDDEVKLFASVEGPIERALVRSGQAVKEGDVVIQIKDAVQQASLRQAEDELKTRKARLRQLQSQQDLETKIRNEQINRAKTQLNMARDDLSKKEAVAGGGVSPQEIANARMQVQLAESRLLELQLPREEIRKGQIEVLQQEIQAAEKAVTLAREQVELRKIRAPISGTVQLQRFEPGEVVKPEHELGQIFDESAWVIKLTLPEKEIVRVRPGQKVEAELAAYNTLLGGKTIIGEITRTLPVVSPQATGDGVFPVEAKIVEPLDLEYYPGMRVSEARIATGKTTFLGRLLD